MKMKNALYLGVVAVAIAAVWAGSAVTLSAQQPARGAVPIDGDDIGGVVTGVNGPEAGVWVIAETMDLPTKFARIVVTDDQGRYVVPDLPKARYQVWVRGYGLVDSPRIDAMPGKQLNLRAVTAPDAAAAAKYYPAIYWYTMMKIPPAQDFGGTTDIPKDVTQELWRRRMNNTDCIGCHQLGQESTRTIPAAFGQFKSGAEAWGRRVASGQTGELMMNRLAVQLGGVPFKYFGDWTDRVAKGAAKPMLASAYWGEEKIWSQRANNHNGMFDKKGRVWFAAAVRGIENPAFCKKGSEHPSAKVFPLDRSGRQVSMLDPKTMKYSFIDTCFGTHHPQFGYDADDTLWLSGSGPVAGWVNTKVWDETGDAARAQGWAPWVLDTNGNGKLDEWTEPDKPAEAGKDTRIAGSGPYAVMPHPTDGSVWYTFNVFVGRPGFVRFDPKTKLSEFYAVPKEGLGVRGGDIDKDGVLWGSGSNGSLISFDRRKCKAPLNGPQATGDHCPEGFAFHQYPGPRAHGYENTSAEASYYTWLDHHNTPRLGANVPISTANHQDGFVAFKDGKMILMRVPYPMGFYAKGLDGRIDDPNARWKGRGLWSSSGDRTPWLMEGGKGSKPRAVHIT